MWRTRRRAAALAQAAAIVALPSVGVGGEGALRFDIAALTLRVGGAAVGVDARLP